MTEIKYYDILHMQSFFNEPDIYKPNEKKSYKSKDIMTSYGETGFLKDGHNNIRHFSCSSYYECILPLLPLGGRVCFKREYDSYIM